MLGICFMFQFMQLDNEFLRLSLWMLILYSVEDYFLPAFFDSTTYELREKEGCERKHPREVTIQQGCFLIQKKHAQSLLFDALIFHLTEMKVYPRSLHTHLLVPPIEVAILSVSISVPQIFYIILITGLVAETDSLSQR